MSIVSDVRDWINTCPSLEAGKLLNVYKVLENDINYSIDPVDTVQTIREFVNGDKLKRFNFYFTSVQRCETTDKELAIQTFLESIVTWIEDQEKAENYPSTNGERITVLNTPSLFSKDAGLSQGIYQILVSYEYREED